MATGLVVVSLLETRTQREVLVQNKNEFTFEYVDFDVYLDGQVVELKPRIEVHLSVQYPFIYRGK